MIVYFDLDGTLIDSAKSSVLSAQETFRHFLGQDIADETIIERMGIPIEVSFRELSNGKINDENWDEVATFFRQRYAINSDEHTTLFTGIEGVLKSVQVKTKHLYIVTSKKSTVADKNLTKLGIRDYFAGIMGSDMVTHYKPDPDPIIQARKLHGLKDMPEITVGDADTDIMMGKAAGTKTCAVTWGSHSLGRLQAAEPDYIANTPEHLRSLLLLRFDPDF